MKCVTGNLLLVTFENPNLEDDLAFDIKVRGFGRHIFVSPSPL